MIDPNMHSQFKDDYYRGMAKAAPFTTRTVDSQIPQSLEISREWQHADGPSQSDYRFVVSKHKEAAALAQVEHLQSVGIDAVFKAGQAYVRDAETFTLAQIELGLR